jgi:hypothetical protein
MLFLLKLVIYPLIFVLLIFAFLPTKQLYYFIQHSVYKKFSITLEETQLNSMPFSFDIIDLNIGLDGERLATLNKLSLNTYVISNSLEISKIYIDDTLPLPYFKGLQNIKISYSLFKPLDIKIEIKSPIFIKGHIYFDIFNLSMNVFMYVRPSQINKVKDITKYFKYQKKGVYVYEYKL